MDELKFTDIFAGPEPVFEVTKRVKGGKKGGMGTLDGWVSKSADKPKMKKAEIEAEMKRMKEQNERFKEEMKQRAEEAKKRKMEEKAKEKERKKEERRLVTELLNEWKKPRDDLECDDLKELPEFASVHCRIPNNLFGDFLSLLEFFHGFSGLLDCYPYFSK